jgi:hypothetical protein
MVYDRYMPDTYHLLGPDPNRRGTNQENRQEADVSRAFIGLVPGLIKHQWHV